MNRTLALALALTLPLSITAQDKPQASAPCPTTKYSSAIETQEQIEARLQTTDCSKMPNHVSETNCSQAHKETRVIQLHNTTQQNDANEILVALRNILDPSVHIYLVSSQDAIVLQTYPQEIERGLAIVRQLDVPRKVYRITFTIITSDAGKRIGVEHYAIIAADGQRATDKQGSKVPVATGSYNATGSPNSATQTQFTYLDVGMNLDVTPSTSGNGVSLKVKVEQSSLGDSQTIAGVTEPVIRQSVYEGTSVLPMGKSIALGSIDIPGTTRHMDIEAMAEPL